MTVLGVDFDPHLVNKWRRQGLTTYYGDMEDPEFAAVLPLSQAKWVVSTIPGDSLSLSLLHSLKNHGFNGRIALTSHTAKELNLFEAEGADLVLLPFRDAASEAARMLAHGPYYVDGA
jgi:Trk K+ transport system NAD-binding subunit